MELESTALDHSAKVALGKKFYSYFARAWKRIPQSLIFHSRKMKLDKFYRGTFLALPLLGLVLNGIECGFLLSIVNLGGRYGFRWFALNNLESLYFFALVNEVMLIYCWYFSEAQLVISYPQSHFITLSDEIVSTVTFVSVVFMGEHTNGTLCADYQHQVDNLIETSSTIMTKEIVAPFYSVASTAAPLPVVSTVSTLSDFIIYVSCNATLSPNWMNGIIRDLFWNPDKLLIPTIVDREKNVVTAGAMISSGSGKWTLTGPNELDSDVPLVPVFSIIGLSRRLLERVTEPRLVTLLSQGRLLELSLYAWFCHGGIRGTTFSKVQMASESAVPEYHWKIHESETVDETVLSQCKSNRSMEWFFHKFNAYDDESEAGSFQIQIGLGESGGSRNCLIAKSDFSIGSEQCEQSNPYMRFRLGGLDGQSQAIMSLGYRRMCLDSGAALTPGSKIILYMCVRNNRNQMFYFDRGKIRWGSFCLADSRTHNSVTLEVCTDDSIDTQIFRADYS